VEFRWEYIEAIKEVFAEPSVRYCGFQVAMRSSDDANVDLDRSRTPDSFEFPLLQDPQQCDLRVGRKVTDFIQEDGAAIRQFKAPERRCIAPVKAPFSWPNNSEEISPGASAPQFTLTKARPDL